MNLMPKDRTPEQWWKELEQGLEYRRRFGVEEKWGEFESIYYNVHHSMLNDGPNIFLSQGDAMLSMITVPSARVRVNPTKPEEVDTAPLVETLDNTLVRDLDVSTEVETACLHAFLFGRGILKQGYDSEWGYDPTLDVGGNLRLGATLTQLNAKGTKRIEYDAAVTPGSPWNKAVDPRDFVVPWGTKEIDQAPWVAIRLCRHIDDLRADRKYQNTRDVQPQMSMRDYVESYRQLQRYNLQRQGTGQKEYVEFYEIHDRGSGKIQVVTWDHDKYLRNETNALQIENRLPFTSMAFTPRTRAFWTTPDAYYLYHIQNELSDVAKQRTNQRRISTLKFLYDKGTISETELEKVLSPDVGVAAAIEPGRDLEKAVKVLQFSPNQELAQEEDLLRANAREQIGFSRNQLGEYTGGRKTASEVNAVDQASRLRMSRRGLQVKRLYEDTVRNLNGIVFTYWTMPRYVKAIGSTNTQEWMRINGPSLRGRYDYQIEFTEAGELEQRKMQALQLYGMLAQDPTIDPVELRNFLGNQVNDPAFTRLFNTQVKQGVSQVRAGQPAGQPVPQGQQQVSPLPTNGTQQLQQLQQRSQIVKQGMNGILGAH